MKNDSTDPLFFAEPIPLLKRKRDIITLLMRISTINIFILLLAVSSMANSVVSNGQNLETTYIDLGFKKKPLLEVFKTIERQTVFAFWISPDGVDITLKVNLPDGSYAVKDALELIFKGTTLRYRQNGNYIVVYSGNAANANVIIEPTNGNQRLVDRQQVSLIKGTIKDAASQEPLAGVNIIVKGTTRGTATDAEGMFAIEASENEILVFTYIGYKTFETTVRNQTMIELSMAADETALGPVEIVGTTYFSTTKEKSTSSIVKITSKDIENQPVTSPLMALQGRVPGLEIMPNNGTPGNAPKIRVRGNNSLRFDGGYPLYIVDGIPIDPAPIKSYNASLMSGGFDPLSTINPSNIESIEVLKDGDATSIYGSRGANGVIVIRTKSGTSDETKTSFDVNVYNGVGQVSNSLDLLSTEQYLSMRREAFKNDNVVPDMNNAVDLTLWDTTRYTDWQNLLLGGTANITDIQGNWSGGNENTSFRFGTGYHKETMVFPGDFGYQRLNGNLGLNHGSANRRFRASISINYGLEKNKLFDDLNLVNYALILPPVAPKLYTDNSNLNWEQSPSGYSTFENPLSLLKKVHDSNTVNLLTNALLTYEIIPDLTVKSAFGLTDLNGNEKSRIPIASTYPENRPFTTGSGTFGNNRRRSWLLEPQLSYSKNFSKHDLDIVIGAAYQQSRNAYQSIIATGYASDALLGNLRGATSYSMTDEIYEYKYASLFAHISYRFKEKYLLSASGRRDGSSRFGPGHRFGNFYSIAPAWIFSNETFVQENINVLSFGKIRMSYGTTGNDQIGDYKYYNTYRIAPNYQGGVSLVPSALHNPDFAWEETKKLEAAIELGFVNNRIFFEVNWYRNRSSNQLVNFQLPAVTGFPSVLRNFNATVENSGWEMILNSKNINKDQFKWTTSLNLSFPRNELVEFDDIQNSPYANTYKVGESLSIQRLYTFTGVNPLNGALTFLDVNANNSYEDGDKQLMRTRDRNYYGGIINTLQFGRFEFSVLLQVSNHELPKFMSSMPGQNRNQPVQVLDHWSFEGDVSNYGAFSQKFVPSYLNYAKLLESDFNIADASFLRLKTVSLAYQFPNQLLSKVKLRECRLFLQGQNLITWTDYINLDPETGSALPPLRMVTIGCQLKF